MCMYVCMYVQTYVHTYMCIHIHIPVHNKVKAITLGFSVYFCTAMLYLVCSPLSVVGSRRVTRGTFGCMRSSFLRFNQENTSCDHSTMSSKWPLFTALEQRWTKNSRYRGRFLNLRTEQSQRNKQRQYGFPH